MFVPDVLGLDLSDGDARWEALKTAQPYAVRGRLGHMPCMTNSIICVYLSL